MADILSSEAFKQKVHIGSTTFHYYCLQKAAEQSGHDLHTLPFTYRILLENIIRNTVTPDGPGPFVDMLFDKNQRGSACLPFYPFRVILQDFTGVPLLVDLAALDDQAREKTGGTGKIEPVLPVDLVIDHSVSIDVFNSPEAADRNEAIEKTRNKQRYEFLKWGRSYFKNLRIVPPAKGIIHQINLEYLAQVVQQKPAGNETVLCPDTLLGTDSHTTMINGIGVLGWGVGGIEAEAAMLGEPVFIQLPPVTCVKLSGRPAEGANATDLVLYVTRALRKQGVVGSFVEFTGDGYARLSAADRATLANMAPEYGATTGFCPVDDATIEYINQTRGDEALATRIETYYKLQSLYYEASNENAIEYDSVIEIDLNKIQPALAGPSRPQDRVVLPEVKNNFVEYAEESMSSRHPHIDKTELSDGSVVIAAITSCTNTSNPYGMIQAGLVARKAVEYGLGRKPWVKTSLAPGSRVVTAYLEKSGLLGDLEQAGFYITGYGCTTCIGNSGPLPVDVSAAVDSRDLCAAGVLSGNRNFSGRIHPQVKANYLASPGLVVAYALAGNMTIDITTEPVGTNREGLDIYLSDLWPSNDEVQKFVQEYVTAELFSSQYNHEFTRHPDWSSSQNSGEAWVFDDENDYIHYPPFVDNQYIHRLRAMPLSTCRALLVLGNSVTTDHISPASMITEDSPAGTYLLSKGVDPKDLHTFGARRGNDEVMVRGTFTNPRIANKLAGSTGGGYTRLLPDGDIMTVFDAAREYQKRNVPLIIIAGKDYGMGSSRDWAAKGTLMLGVRAVIAESYERIHRSNLVMMGVLPLEFTNGQNAESLGLDGRQVYDLSAFEDRIEPGVVGNVSALTDDSSIDFELKLRIDNEIEKEYYTKGGILPYILESFIS